MPEHRAARLHLPRPALGACVHLGVERDTRGLQLTDEQRFNCYPATPLATMSWILEGELHMVEWPSPGASSLSPALPRAVFSGPYRRPSASWAPGPVHALTVAFYPEALSRLFGLSVAPFLDRILPLDQVLTGRLLDQFSDVGKADGREPYQRVEAVLLPLCSGADGGHGLPTLRGWVQSMAVRAAFSNTGTGLRRAQRRFKHWTGQSHRDLQLFTRAETAMAGAVAKGPNAASDLASVAADTGFADQSHMGREVRRVTGVPPGRLVELMRAEEPFWFYRLLGEHLRNTTEEECG